MISIFSQRKTKNSNKDSALSSDKYLEIEGRRIVEISNLSKNLRCEVCDERIFLDHILDEHLVGLKVQFAIRCQECLHITTIETCQTDSHRFSDVNLKLAIGKYFLK